MMGEEIDIGAAERLILDLEKRGIRMSLMDARRVGIEPLDRVSEEETNQLAANRTGILRTLKRDLPWMVVEASAAGLIDGGKPGSWEMAQAYRDWIGGPRDVIARWLDILRRSPSHDPSMTDLKTRIIEIVSNRAWVEKAIRKGWSERQLLGICPSAPHTRPDAQGAIVSIALQVRAGLTVVRVTEDRITFRRKGGSRRLVHHRRLAGIADAVPVWEAIVTGVADDRHMAN